MVNFRHSNSQKKFVGHFNNSSDFLQRKTVVGKTCLKRIQCRVQLFATNLRQSLVARLPFFNNIIRVKWESQISQKLSTVFQRYSSIHLLLHRLGHVISFFKCVVNLAVERLKETSRKPNNSLQESVSREVFRVYMKRWRC